MKERLRYLVAFVLWTIIVSCAVGLLWLGGMMIVHLISSCRPLISQCALAGAIALVVLPIAATLARPPR